MADFTMPSLGADMDAGTLVEWLVQPGEEVGKGDLMAVVETDKGAIEIETFHGGTVERLLVEPGAAVPVGTVLARLSGDGAAGEPPAPSPAVPSVAASSSAALAAAAATPPVASVASTAPSSGLRASPYARHLAAVRSLDLAGIIGSGPRGAIVAADLPMEPSAPAPAAPAAPGDMRQAIARAMARSKREIPHYYLSTDIDLSTALAWLEVHNAAVPPPERLLPAVLLLKATALAVAKVPEVNGLWTDGALQVAEQVNLGVAISLRTGGLIAPALLGAHSTSLGDLMLRFSDLVQRTRRGRLRRAELLDATLTVTSLGDRGVDAVIGVIYPPQVALVGFGRIRQRPWVVDGQIVPRPIVTASLAGDHRAHDGHRGGLFLSAIDHLLQHPEEL